MACHEGMRRGVGSGGPIHRIRILPKTYGAGASIKWQPPGVHGLQHHMSHTKANIRALQPVSTYPIKRYENPRPGSFFYYTTILHIMKVTWDEKVCTHSAKCVENLPSVFKVQDGRFVIIQDGASQDEIRRVVGMCPSGALQVS